MRRWADPLMLRQALPRVHASFGGESRAVTNANVTTSLNDRPRATLTLADVAAPIDYLAELQLSAEADETQRVMFTGFVDTADPHDDSVGLVAVGATELSERTAGRTIHQGVPAVDIIYLLTRDAGYTDDRLRLEGLDSLPTEVFQVILPIAGLQLQKRIDVCGVTLIPISTSGPGASPLRQIFESLQLGPFGCVAVTFETAARMYEAEARAVARIRVAIDSLLAAAIYGLSRAPDGVALPYRRTTVRSRPAVLQASCVHGLGTDRTWVRETRTTPLSPVLDAGSLRQRWAHLLQVPPPPHLVNALAALRRAADEAESAVQRGQALWDAIEFLCAGTSVEKLFTKADGRRIRDAVAAVELSKEQRSRLDQALGYLNEPSLAVRMHARAAHDGVPLSNAEVDLLRRARQARNDAAHGRAIEAPNDDELRWATSIVARLIVYRWHTEGNTQSD